MGKGEGLANREGEELYVPILHNLTSKGRRCIGGRGGGGGWA